MRHSSPSKDSGIYNLCRLLNNMIHLMWATTTTTTKQQTSMKSLLNTFVSQSETAWAPKNWLRSVESKGRIFRFRGKPSMSKIISLKRIPKMLCCGGNWKFSACLQVQARCLVPRNEDLALWVKVCYILGLASCISLSYWVKCWLWPFSFKVSQHY